MDNARWERLQAIFHEAAAQPESERWAYIETASGGDAQLLRDVAAMLKADERAASLLDRGLPEVAYRMVGESVDTMALREFGPYRLKRILGEGGMGVVWLAERTDTGQLVAVKFLPHAGLSPARRERFGREIKTLARLKHPYIARLYDAGTLADGTPWFVMEYVEGVRLTEYCREQQLPVEARLRLFRKICEAVQYAHGQAIIHRDLKPSNILVETDGAPRLLDFGIARELQTSDEVPDLTRPGLRFLSPPYAAPEWVRDGTVGLSTDVYSLGVILYEMLAGRLLSSGHLPEKPSAAAGDTSVRKSAWSDLDTLCFTAMHPDPEQRYRSIEALIRDIDHYLGSEPLEARSDTVRYRAGKFIQRHRPAVIASAVVAMLVIGLVTFFTLRLARERNLALTEAGRTRRIQHFMLNLFGAGDREAAPSNDLRVVTLLDRGAREATILNSDPETQAELYQNLGRMYSMLGRFQSADQMMHLGLERMKSVTGAESPKVAEILIQMALLRADQAQFRDAERLIRQAQEVARHLRPDDLTVLRAKAALGRILSASGAYGSAIAVLDPLVRTTPTGEEGTYILVEALPALAAARQNTGHIPAAEALNRRALTLDRQLFGNSHPRVGMELGEIAAAEANLGRYPEAERLYREALNIYQAWYGRKHPETAQYLNLVGLLMVHTGRFSEAEPLLKEALGIQEQTFGKVHPLVALACDTLGTVALLRGDLSAAEAYASRAVAIDRELFGDSDHQTAVAKAHLAQVFMKQERYDRAEPLLLEAVNVLRPLSGNLAAGAVEALLGRVLVREHRYREAEQYLMRAYAMLKQHPGTSYLKRLQELREDLATVYESLREPEKAATFRAELAASQSGT